MFSTAPFSNGQTELCAWACVVCPLSKSGSAPKPQQYSHGVSSVSGASLRLHVAQSWVWLGEYPRGHIGSSLRSSWASLPALLSLPGCLPLAPPWPWVVWPSALTSGWRPMYQARMAHFCLRLEWWRGPEASASAPESPCRAATEEQSCLGPRAEPSPKPQAQVTNCPWRLAGSQLQRVGPEEGVWVPLWTRGWADFTQCSRVTWGWCVGVVHCSGGSDSMGFVGQESCMWKDVMVRRLMTRIFPSPFPSKPLCFSLFPQRFVSDLWAGHHSGYRLFCNYTFFFF